MTPTAISRCINANGKRSTVMREHDNRVGSIPGISMPPNHRFSTYRLSPAPPPLRPPVLAGPDATSYRSLYNVLLACAREPSNRELHLAVRRAYLRMDGAWVPMMKRRTFRLLVGLSPGSLSILSIVFASKIACPRATVPRTARPQWGASGSRG